MPVIVLGSDDYLGSSPEAQVLDGVSADTHIAMLDVDQSGVGRQCFVKLYSPLTQSGSANRGLINEIVGHVVAEECGCNVPGHVGVIKILPYQLPYTPSWLKGVQEPQPLMGWWSQDMAYPSLKAYFNSPPTGEAKSKVKSDLLASANLYQTIALDYVLANIDRNVGNLLKTNGNSYILIDHGKCLTGEDWEAIDLLPEREYKNKILEIIGEPERSADKFKSATVKAHEHIASSIRSAVCSLYPWLEKVLKDSNEIEAVSKFIEDRGSNSDFAQTMGLLS